MQHHLITVGISLLTNFEREHNDERKHKTTREETLKKHEQILEFINKNPTRACAELNSLNAKTNFLEKTNGNPFGITLVYTDTQIGKFSATMIKTFLERKGFKPIEVKLNNLAIPKEELDAKKAQKLVNKGLQELQTKIKKHIEKLTKKTPDLNIYINATGGFKAQVAILYGLGKELNIPVYYMHEEYQNAIELP